MINIEKNTVYSLLITNIYIYILCLRAQLTCRPGNLPSKDMLYNEGHLDRTMCGSMQYGVYKCIPQISADHL